VSQTGLVLEVDLAAHWVSLEHSTQLLLKIGATSFANVGAGLPSAAKAVAGRASSMANMSFLMPLILAYGRVVGYLIPSCSR